LASSAKDAANALSRSAVEAGGIALCLVVGRIKDGRGSSESETKVNMKRILITLFVALVCAAPVAVPSSARAAAIVVEVGDRAYYRGPWYWGPRHERLVWIPGHWSRFRHHWIHGHYARR
jgi:hypothetical protein